ncbi:hypothetical protein [Paenibacillus apis]|uniref:hypothetical protein n=1 Tax=Paenibacillus apis TaxID=1792174 RepID=UPI00265B5128|nr:hypothetical protein [Paenibacillus apis]
MEVGWTPRIIYRLSGSKEGPLNYQRSFFMEGAQGAVRKNNKNPPEERRFEQSEPDWSQPASCRGCVWGRFEGSSQFCSLPRCIAVRESLQGQEVNGYI